MANTLEKVCFMTKLRNMTAFKCCETIHVLRTEKKTRYIRHSPSHCLSGRTIIVGCLYKEI